MTNGAHGGGKILCLHVRTHKPVLAANLERRLRDRRCVGFPPSQTLFTLVQLLQLH